MADTIRELERRWRETGATEDEARWLQARLRAGELDVTRVELAAYLDDPAARAVIAPPPRAWPNDPEARLRAWGKGLSDHGVEACARAAVAEGHHKLGIVLRPGVLTPGGELARSACVRLIVRRLEALEDWILSGAVDGLTEFNGALAPIAFPVDVDDVVAWAYEQVLDLTERVAGWQRLGGARVAFGTWWNVDFPFGEVSATRRAIQSELTPWALGLEDPLRTRLERMGVSSPCSADWGAMHGDERVRRCAQCELDVFNLSELTRAEAQALVRARDGRLCVRFFRREDGTVVTKDCPVGLAGELEPHRYYPEDAMLGDVFGDV
jgi:hypothetical protein